ncbi:MAG: PA14 domain-containing protein, partial [Bacteroidota bacterium]
DGTYDTPAEQIAFSRNGEWEAPSGTVFIKHFELPMDESDPTNRRRLETRFTIMGQDGKAYGLTYRWRADMSDADLLEGAYDETFTIQTASGTRSQTWHYPSRSECITCHNDAVKGTLGPRTRFLNKDFTYPATGVTANQLTTLSSLGVLDEVITETDLPNYITHAPTDDYSVSLEHRARSYLDLNCAYCHRPETGNRAVFDARLSTPLIYSNLFSDQLNESLGLSDEYIVKRQDTANSVLYKRIHTTDPTIAMPPLARNEIDEEGAALIADWIMNMSPENCVASGGILMERWDNIGPGVAVNLVPVGTEPTSSQIISDFEIPVNTGNTYGARVSGYICPPQTGPYTFWISGDDNCELWLSTDDDPANKVRIAHVPGWTRSRQWDKYPEQQSTQTYLEAGRSYYVEAIVKEQYGGDNLAVGWTLPDGTLERPITGSVLAPRDNEPAPVSACLYSGEILMERWDNIEGGVSVDLVPVNTVPTSTQNLSLFEIPVNVAENYGARVRGYICPPETGDYTFWISGDDNCELWLSTDGNPANKTRIAHVPGWTSSRQWDKYAEQQSGTIALEAGVSYYVEAIVKEQGGGDNLAVGWQLPSGTLQRPIDGAHVAPPLPASPCLASGTISMDQWNNIGAGVSVDLVPVNTAPSSSQELDIFEIPVNTGDTYGARVRGYICPPQTGLYTFWISGDDNCELWLSNSIDPAGKTRIAYVPGWTSSRLWTKYPQQKSALVLLHAGVSYYIEAIVKEQYGGDNLAVGWTLPDGSMERPIEGPALAPYTDPNQTPGARRGNPALGSPIFVANAITAYPNPVAHNQELQIALDLVETQTVQIQVFDLQGRQILRQESVKDAGKQSVALSVHEWPSGYYVVTVAGIGWKASEKVVVQ